MAAGYLSGAYYKITGVVPICSQNTDKVIVVVKADSKYMLIDDIVKAEKKSIRSSKKVRVDIKHPLIRKHSCLSNLQKIKYAAIHCDGTVDQIKNF